MTENHKVSVVIPNYNREKLISDTLDSILAQTYQNWECIIVDDGSTDNSIKVIEEYIAIDNRFKLYQRPSNYPKGANACRNIGMQKSQGNYIIFFDSDDLMKTNHIEKKLKYINSQDYDFIVTKSIFFNQPPDIPPMNYREINHVPINADNFITKKINWITFDPLIKASIAKQIQFTEKNQSAEEYNYFCKLVLLTQNAKFFEDILTLRRYHQGSYQVNLDDESKLAHNQFYYFYDTYLEIKNLKISKTSRQYLLDNAISVYYKKKKYLQDINKWALYNHIIREFTLLKALNRIRIIEIK